MPFSLCIEIHMIWAIVRWWKHKPNLWSRLVCPLVGSDQVMRGSRALISAHLKAKRWILFCSVWYQRFWNRTSIQILWLSTNTDRRMSRINLTSNTSVSGRNENNPVGSSEIQRKCKDKVWRQKKGLNKIIHLVNPTKKRENIHYTPVFYGEISGRLGKSKFHSPRILLNSGVSSSIVLGKHTNKLTKKYSLSHGTPKVVRFRKTIPDLVQLKTSPSLLLSGM